MENSGPEFNCADCEACCCRLEVMLFSDLQVPNELIVVDQWGGEVMRRLDDGWCAAVDRNTLRCTIYDNRPWVCREFVVGSSDCVEQRRKHMQRRQDPGNRTIVG